MAPRDEQAIPTSAQEDPGSLQLQPNADGGGGGEVGRVREDDDDAHLIPSLILMCYVSCLPCQSLLEAQVASEREQYQPTAAEKVFAIVKSMLLRAMIIYFIMQFFK